MYWWGSSRVGNAKPARESRVPTGVYGCLGAVLVMVQVGVDVMVVVQVLVMLHRAFRISWCKQPTAP